MKDKVTILIPALNPDEKLVNLIHDLLENDFSNIIVVNDGSDDKHSKYFKQIEDNAVILKHAVNLGKGRALKTGINYYINNYSNNNIGIITLDADGQHKISDVNKIYTEMISNINSLILGVRNFNSKSIPFRSRFGNKITRYLFGFLTGIKIQDTQTRIKRHSK